MKLLSSGFFLKSLLKVGLVCFGLASFTNTAAVNDNYRLCMSGYDMLCDERLLTAQQQQQYQISKRERNFATCMSGYDMLCDVRLLTQDQRQQVQSRTRQPYGGNFPVGSPCAENGSCYGDISELTGRPKTVPVQGYYRKDGTYVRGHYRSRPRK